MLERKSVSGSKNSLVVLDCGLYIIGSSLTGFGSCTSDMDVCLMLYNREVSFDLQYVNILVQFIGDSIHFHQVSIFRLTKEFTQYKY